MSAVPGVRGPGRRRPLLRAVLMLVLAALVATLAVAVHERVGRFDAGGPAPAVSGSAALAWFYRPPVNASERDLSDRFERYILTRHDEDTLDNLIAAGVDEPFLQYVRFEAIMDDSGLGYTWGNQVAHRAGDWERISRDHPDWFLRDAAGGLIPAGTGDYSETRFYLMDPANPEWRQFFLSRLREMQLDGEWDGVFLDNVEGSFDKRVRTGAVPAGYTEAEYRAAIADFLHFLRVEYFDPEERPVEANLIEMPSPETYAEYLPHLDGAMLEGWAVGWDRDDFGGVESWESELDTAERIQAAGKHVWLVTQGERDDLERFRFAFGSFLLVAEDGATFRYTNAESYDEVWDYPEYDLDLGDPLGPRTRTGDVWTREFENGRVAVDPDRETATITVDP